MIWCIGGRAELFVTTVALHPMHGSVHMCAIPTACRTSEAVNMCTHVPAFILALQLHDDPAHNISNWHAHVSGTRFNQDFPNMDTSAWFNHRHFACTLQCYTQYKQNKHLLHGTQRYKGPSKLMTCAHPCGMWGCIPSSFNLHDLVSTTYDECPSAELPLLAAFESCCLVTCNTQIARCCNCGSAAAFDWGKGCLKHPCTTPVATHATCMFDTPGVPSWWHC